jgi:hypothetical protein
MNVYVVYAEYRWEGTEHSVTIFKNKELAINHAYEEYKNLMLETDEDAIKEFNEEGSYSYDERHSPNLKIYIRKEILDFSSDKIYSTSI